MNNKFGFNINLKNNPDEIRALGRKYLASGEFSMIEVTCYENMHGVDVFEYNKAVMEICNLYKPQVSTHLIELNLAEQNSIVRAATLSEIDNCCRYTASLGGRFVVIHAGMNYGNIHAPIVRPDGSRGTAEDNLKVTINLSVELMKDACYIAKKYGITILTENLAAPSFCQDSATLLKYVEEVDCDNLKIVFDVGHCYHTGHDVVSELRALKPFLAHTHIHDNHGSKDEHLDIGDGTLDFKAFISTLEEMKYDGCLLFELYRSKEDNLGVCRQKLIDCMKDKPQL